MFPGLSAVQRWIVCLLPIVDSDLLVLQPAHPAVHSWIQDFVQLYPKVENLRNTHVCIVIVLAIGPGKAVKTKLISVLTLNH